MRVRSQVVLPLDLEIKIKKDDRVFLMHEICDQLDYTGLGSLTVAKEKGCQKR